MVKKKHKEKLLLRSVLAYAEPSVSLISSKIVTITWKLITKDTKKENRYYNYTFKFFPGYDCISEKLEYRMNLRFKSNDESKVLKLVEKRWEDLDTLITHDVYNNKKFKTGMTATQLDKIMEGKGIGPYETVRYKDYSKLSNKGT